MIRQRLGSGLLVVKEWSVSGQSVIRQWPFNVQEVDQAAYTHAANSMYLSPCPRI